MIGHLVRRARAEKRAALCRIDDFCEAQEARVRATVAEFEARRLERIDPFVREWETLELEVRR